MLIVSPYTLLIIFTACRTVSLSHLYPKPAASSTQHSRADGSSSLQRWMWSGLTDSSSARKAGAEEGLSSLCLSSSLRFLYNLLLSTPPEGGSPATSNAYLGFAAHPCAFGRTHCTFILQLFVMGVSDMRIHSSYPFGGHIGYMLYLVTPSVLQNTHIQVFVNHLSKFLSGFKVN